MKFPSNFLFGYSWSGFQFEMGLPGSEVESDWWIWVHDKENIFSGLVSGDLPEHGPAYWHLYKQDHDIAERLGMDAIRGGIEWMRIFPKPTFDVKVDVEKDENGNIVSIDVSESAIKELEELANMKALNHYREIYSDWKKRGKTFILNLYHWPLPLWLHDPIGVRRLGPDRAPSGWLDERSVVEFTKFAAFVAYHLDDLVDTWSTMNEPNVVYEQGYTRPQSGFPPGYLSHEAAQKAKLNLMQAHARAYNAIKEHSDKPVGLIYSFVWHDALNEEAEGIVKGIKKRHYNFVTGLHSGSSEFGEREDFKGKLDWIGVNYYTRVAYEMRNGRFTALPGYGYMCERSGYAKSGRPASDFGWEMYPEGLENVLKDLKELYSLPMMVTENGMADMTDRHRSYYLVSHLAAIHRAMKEGADVRGYLHWSLTDNYEWAQGFRMRFGLVMVDLETKKRYLRPSALVFREIATRREIPEELQHLANLDLVTKK